MHSPSFKISGNLIDVVKREIYPATLRIEKGIIKEIVREKTSYNLYLVPGFVDAHIHIESSMLVPSEFAREAVKHGTVATVSDPHEIANVMGMDGVRFMIENGRQVPFYFYFGAPSCVPATPFESAGNVISPKDIEELLKWDEIVYLAEMMNFPGVLNSDPDVMAKLEYARKTGKPVDGHAPGLSGEDAARYFGAGISTDHECFSFEEAKEKADLGVKILIREGSAARNFDTLLPLLKEFPDQVMFCSDDKHPDELLQGHINQLVQRALQHGYDPFDVLSACTLNPVKHYGLRTGLLQSGDPADFLVVDSPTLFNVSQTYIKGVKVFDRGKVLISRVQTEPVNNFSAKPVNESDLQIPAESAHIKVIKAIDNEIITEEMTAILPVLEGKLQSDIGQDILKMVVLNRYEPAAPAVGFIHNFGLKKGAIASTVAHDSHNIIAVGVDDASICKAINLLIKAKGGICAVNNSESLLLPLPVAGLMSVEPAETVAGLYHTLDAMAKNMGSRLTAPFMTLSFMSLLVIPKLKLSDKGLFDGNKFQFTPLYV
jgi:adenine deaminase